MTGTRGAAVVTGGASGLAQAFVTAPTAAGYAVMPVDLHGTERRVDVTDADARRTLADGVPPDIWVNNAGVSCGDALILDVASLAGWGLTPHIVIYSATKHGVRAFSVALAAELCNSSVRVQCLLPDGIDTPMVDPDDERQVHVVHGTTPPRPESIATAGMALMRSRAVVASVPHRRGTGVRLLGGVRAWR